MKEERLKKKKKKRKPLNKQQLIVGALFLVTGGVCGFIIAQTVDKISSQGFGTGMELIMLGVSLILMCLMLYLQIILHEGGHLIAGLMSGYKFSSFRIGNIMLLKEEEGYRFKKFSLAGTGGQCLMSPPDLKDGEYPFKLYNYGGVIINLITGMVGLGLYFMTAERLFSELWLIFGLIGFAFALANGIPFKLDMVSNDGYNARELGKNAAARRAFWLQLKVNESVSRGLTLKDMPEEWFEMPSAEDMNNGIVSAIGVFSCNRLMEEHRFAEANNQMKCLLSSKANVAGIYVGLLNCDRMFCELVSDREERTEIARRLYDSVGEKFMKTMKTFPTIVRTQYVYALLVEKNEEKANTYEKTFDKISKNYPYPGDIENERSFMKLAYEKYQMENLK